MSAITEFVRLATTEGEDDPTWLYLLAWAIATLLSAAGSLLVEDIVSWLLGQAKADLGLYLSVSSFCGAALSLLIWIGVYRVFASLKIRKVMPWLLVLGSLTCLLGMFMTTGQLAQNGFRTPTSYYVVTVAVNLGFFFTFYLYFSRNGRWR